MTKKDYELIARIIARFPNDAITIPKGRLIEDFCVEFRLRNPNFDPNKFRRACGWYDAD